MSGWSHTSMDVDMHTWEIHANLFIEWLSFSDVRFWVYVQLHILSNITNKLFDLVQNNIIFLFFTPKLQSGCLSVWTWKSCRNPQWPVHWKLQWGSQGHSLHLQQGKLLNLNLYIFKGKQMSYFWLYMKNTPVLHLRARCIVSSNTKCNIILRQHWTVLVTVLGQRLKHLVGAAI